MIGRVAQKSRGGVSDRLFPHCRQCCMTILLMCQRLSPPVGLGRHDDSWLRFPGTPCFFEPPPGCAGSAGSSAGAPGLLKFSCPSGLGRLCCAAPLSIFLSYLDFAIRLSPFNRYNVTATNAHESRTRLDVITAGMLLDRPNPLSLLMDIKRIR